MSTKELKFWKIASYVLVFPIICFGPIVGVVAAGYLFGECVIVGLSMLALKPAISEVPFHNAESVLFSKCEINFGKMVGVRCTQAT